MKFDVTALGEILIDFINDGNDDDKSSRFLKKAGGAPINFLATASAFGLKTAFIGKAGKDIFGKYLLNVLEENKINADNLIFDEEHNTTLAFVEIDENGDRSFSFYRKYGADTYLEESDVDENLIKNSKVFHFGSLSFTSEKSSKATLYALKIAKENGCVVTYDPNYREALWKSEDEAVKTMKENLQYADIVKFSNEEVQMITGKRDKNENLKEISEKYNIKIVLITDAENGVNYFCNGNYGHLDSLKVECVDTTGAGDIFFGTFVSQLIKANENVENVRDIESYVRKAIEVSGKSTLKKGAISSIPEIK